MTNSEDPTLGVEEYAELEVQKATLNLPTERRGQDQALDVPKLDELGSTMTLENLGFER